jgi:hypothetical protein
MSLRTSYLDEFQHIRLEKRPAACPPHGGPAALPSKHDDCRNVTVSSLFGPNQPNQPSAHAKNQPSQQGPARTTPPTSLFLPMQLSNSRNDTDPPQSQSAVREPRSAGRLSARPAKTRPQSLGPQTQKPAAKPETGPQANKTTKNPPAPPLSRWEVRSPSFDCLAARFPRRRRQRWRI